MKALLAVVIYILKDQRASLARGALLSVVVLVMGASLLGLSGWFITAAAAAGIAGAGAVFDVFRPSAMVRFLALGRTAARYGERLLTHDATLRSLTSLRVRLLSSLSRQPFERLTRLRAAQVLNRLTADVDALDGVPLRLVLPIAAALLTHLLAWFVLSWLVDPRIGALVALGYALGGAVVFWIGIVAARRLSVDVERSAQSFRTRLIDLIAVRADLAVYGQLAAQSQGVAEAEQSRALAAARLDRIDRLAGAGLTLTAALVTAGTIWLGGDLVQGGDISAAQAAIGIFVALALIESIAPLRRALVDLGRMMQAARTVAPQLGAPTLTGVGDGVKPAGVLRLNGVSFARRPGARPVLDGLTLRAEPGKTLVLTGPSGAGKSTVLLLAAGLLEPGGGEVLLGDLALRDWDEQALRRAVTLVPQRSALLAESIADNLRLADPDASDGEMWAALGAVELADVIEAKGELAARLGPQGAGLSGGEARRLVLARALLRRPDVLLLDEPTEGLDRATAQRVLRGLRRALPDAAFVIAAHRDEERAIADVTLDLTAG